ncbi:MAG: 16S rRNA (guanine(966)-N(2))-methyltransferase RsmD [Bryobacterales bacterium]|nr:16S rRNA (guanine(966)-N(2))-methyltransferase RsmD [Bryobacterales bacterium]
MRIIAGEFKGRRLKSVPGMATRPTPDRLRESLFSVLTPELPRCRFADLFAGTGAVGLEALSRGAAEVIFVEIASRAQEVLRENIRALGATGTKVVGQPVKRALRSLHADIVFLDPPYDDAQAYTDTLEALKESDASLILVQHQPKQALAERYGAFERKRRLRQGDNVVSFYRRSEPEPTPDQPSPSP